MWPRFKTYLPMLALLTITFFTLRPCLDGGFISWDDPAYLIYNPLVQDFSPSGIVKIFFSFFKDLYMPLVFFSFAAEHQAFGLAPLAYHTTNLALHLINTGLVYLLLLAITRHKGKAFLAALLFGIHPAHVESVAWVTERKDMLYSLFFLLGCLSYWRFLNTQKVRSLWATVPCLILSLMAKPMAVLMPVLFLLFDLMAGRKREWRRIYEKIPLFIVVAVFLLINLIATFKGPGNSSFLTGLPQNFLAAGYGLLFHLGKILWPERLSPLYPPYFFNITDPAPLGYYAASLAFAVLTFAVWRLRRRVPPLLWGYAFYVINILPVVGLIPRQSLTPADRYTYIPAIGIFYLLAEGFVWLYRDLIERDRRFKVLLITVLVVNISVLAVIAHQRCRVWTNSVTFWTDVLRQYQNLWPPYINRGWAYAGQHEYGKALADFTANLEVDPNRRRAFRNRAAILFKMGRYDEAIADYSTALTFAPADARTYADRAEAYRAKGDLKHAGDDLQTARELSRRASVAEKPDLLRDIHPLPRKALQLRPGP